MHPVLFGNNNFLNFKFTPFVLESSKPFDKHVIKFSLDLISSLLNFGLPTVNICNTVIGPTIILSTAKCSLFSSVWEKTFIFDYFTPIGPNKLKVLTTVYSEPTITGIFLVKAGFYFLKAMVILNFNLFKDQIHN